MISASRLMITIYYYDIVAWFVQVTWHFCSIYQSYIFFKWYCSCICDLWYLISYNDDKGCKNSSQIVLNEQRIETILDSGAVCRPVESFVTGFGQSLYQFSHDFLVLCPVEDKVTFNSFVAVGVMAPIDYRLVE